jgi:diadenosine tetraphosphate (Ap4A) HIT family hydrolase
MYILSQKFAEQALFIGELPLCSVLLMNNSLYPWIILVPKRDDVFEINDLSPDERAQFMEDVAAASTVMKNTYWPDKINIASMGNNVPHLHMHVVARFKTDDIWPEPVWNKASKPYTEQSIEEAILVLRREFKKLDEFVTIANDQ